MKNKILTYSMSLVLSFTSWLCQAQDTAGIHFETSRKWNDQITKAKIQHKYIFVDAYASWCGPCKLMDKETYLDEEVGKFFNEHFISVKMQVDTTNVDDESIKAAYGDAHNLMTRYRIGIYPSMLFFDTNGKLVHRSVGYKNSKAFITLGKDALDPKKQYATLLGRYKHGEKDSALLAKLIFICSNYENAADVRQLHQDYISSLKNVFTQGQIDTVNLMINSSLDPGILFFRNNAIQVNQLKGKNFAEERVCDILIKENKTIQNLGTDKSSVQPNWNLLQQGISERWGDEYAQRIISRTKMLWAKKQKEWAAYATLLVEWFSRYGESDQDHSLNNNAYYVFQYSNNKRELETALNWSRKVNSKYDFKSALALDTYANILYKLDRKDEAISWEEKAVQYDPKNKENIANLAKMKAGERTW